MNYLFISLLQRAISGYLALDPETITKLSALSGRVLKLTLTDLGYSIYLLPNAQGVTLTADYHGDVHADIRGSSVLLMRMQLSEEGNATLLAKQLTIQGDLHLAQTFNHIFRHIHIDWEELLSHVTGDVIAHQVGRFARNFRQWRRQTTHTLNANLVEYLQQEAQQLPSREMVEDFYAQLHQLRDDVERLELRLTSIII